MSNSFVEESKTLWWSAKDHPSIESLKLGCLQRIATAMELSCKDRESLERRLENYKAQTAFYRNDITRLTRSNAALRGVINRLKKATP